MRFFSTLFSAVLLLAASTADAKNVKSIQLDNERLIVARGDVDETMAVDVINKLVQFDAKDRVKPIYMIINSYGGSIPDGARIIAALDATEAPVVCLVDEKAYSMAAVLLQYCDERYIQKYADILFHPASYRVGGQEGQVASLVKHIQDQLDHFHQDVAFRLKMTTSGYKKQIQDDWWMTAEQAIKAGAADGIVDSLKYSYTPPPPVFFFFFRKEAPEYTRSVTRDLWWARYPDSAPVLTENRE